MSIGKLGVFYFIDSLSAPQAADFARTVERLGYGALWYPEAVGRNSMVTAAWLLTQTRTLTVASGIANIFARDAQAAAGGRHALNELSGGRFLMGLGVSHAPLVEDLRGHIFKNPLQRMRDYIEKMNGAVYQSPMPEQSGELVLAALGPKMTALAGELSDGAYPYNVTPEHTARSRAILGPGKKLYVEQKVLLETDPAKARAVARESLGFYLSMVNYQNTWATLGFVPSDWEQASDKFLDAMVAWGDEEAIRKRIDEHLQAGADHVCIQPLGDPGKVLELLAPGAGETESEDLLERGSIRR
jgi:probable F420-dependent oxidoreductase